MTSLDILVRKQAHVQHGFMVLNNRNTMKPTRLQITLMANWNQYLEKIQREKSGFIDDDLDEFISISAKSTTLARSSRL